MLFFLKESPAQWRIKTVFLTKNRHCPQSHTTARCGPTDVLLLLLCLQLSETVLQRPLLGLCGIALNLTSKHYQTSTCLNAKKYKLSLFCLILSVTLEKIHKESTKTAVLAVDCSSSSKTTGGGTGMSSPPRMFPCRRSAFGPPPRLPNPHTTEETFHEPELDQRFRGSFTGSQRRRRRTIPQYFLSSFPPSLSHRICVQQKTWSQIADSEPRWQLPYLFVFFKKKRKEK